MVNKAGISEPDSEKSPVNHTNEIQMFRCKIRNRNWLNCGNELISIDGKPLHPNLLELLEIAGDG